jgi:EAL domain-containing protein (putative c-di-GMP-specific phosphodiesterase class I)
MAVAVAKAQEKFLHSLVGRLTGWDHPEERLKVAFAQDEFILYSQSIIKLAAGGNRRAHQEVFVRLLEEERNMTPPGAFLPAVESLKLGPRLDLHVLRKTLRWYRSPDCKAEPVMHVNLCHGTLSVPDFARVIAAELDVSEVAGDCLCFEIAAADWMHVKGIVEFIGRLKAVNCTVAIGLPEKDPESIDRIYDLRPDFIKIGGDLVWDLEEDPARVDKLRYMVQACHDAGIRAIAQNVERPRTLDTLIGIGVDYAQGFGIAKPGPLGEPPPR